MRNPYLDVDQDELLLIVKALNEYDYSLRRDEKEEQDAVLKLLNKINEVW